MRLAHTISIYLGRQKLDYALLDARGREYSPTRTKHDGPPKFTVHKDGQQIGGGSLEYG